MTTYPKRTPLEAIRLFCLACMGGSPQTVTDCLDSACPFHPYRNGTALMGGKHRPLAAIKTYCRKNCLPDSADDIRTCGGDTALLGPCPVFPFRMGKNPNISAETKKQRQRRAQKQAREDTTGVFKQPHHGPFFPSESTQAPRGEL